MITSTVLAVFFVPVFYVAIQWLSELRSGPPRREVTEETPTPPGPPPAPDTRLRPAERR
jgi:hydrophobic/amphiphilic exporter-1 (mainly G- bacteria), HAE1 family